MKTEGSPSRFNLYCAAFDFYDHWAEVDPLVSKKHPTLPPYCEALAFDVNNIAVIAGELLRWVHPRSISQSKSVVVVGTLVEAYIVNLRSAADVIGAMAAYGASLKFGQAPNTSLNDLLKWAKKNPSKVRPQMINFLHADWAWLYEMRTMRDLLVHQGLHANIHCDGKQFNLWVHCPKRGWIVREPLFPLLARWTHSLLKAAENCGSSIAAYVDLPIERKGARVLNGVCIPQLHRFLKNADKFAFPSP